MQHRAVCHTEHGWRWSCAWPQSGKSLSWATCSDGGKVYLWRGMDLCRGQERAEAEVLCKLHLRASQSSSFEKEQLDGEQSKAACVGV